MNLRALLPFLLLSVAAPGVALAQEPPLPMTVPMGAPAPPPPFITSAAIPAPGVFIPPDLALRLGIPQATLDRVESLTFEANEALISLEADVRRAQLELEKLLRSPAPDEATVGRVVDTLSRAEAAVRKNRLGLLIQIRKLLGQELWRKLEAALHEDMRKGGPVRVIQGPFQRKLILEGPPPPGP